MEFPVWSYFPRNAKPPTWVHQFVSVVTAGEAIVSTAKESGLKSDDVLAALAPGLAALGYSVEAGKKREQKITARCSSARTV